MVIKLTQRCMFFHVIKTCLHKQIPALLNSPSHLIHQKQLRSYESKLNIISDPFYEGISEVIDTRSPDEYKTDHIPGAINLPVLYNKERADVGTMYNENSFEARKTGATIVAKHISEYLETYFNNKPQSYSPLIYCWRGGQRSRSLGIILSEIGLTGCGKTYLLKKLQEHGEQVLDLEGLAKHKGSVLGQYQDENQPTQKYWESLLRHKLLFFNQELPVWVESESAKIGRLFIPQNLFNEMCKSKRFCIQLPISERVKYILEDYNYFINDINSLKNLLNSLRKLHSNKTIDQWIELAEKGSWEDFVHVILWDHYDKMYTHSQKKNNLSNNEENVIMADFTNNSVDLAIEYLIEKRQNW
ncbi:hypothetical protein KUTeg_012830 [Tegillarca granosa]|uniref:Rhodanese domain-containing protein n=1 Tax=Tegillarca granosa TaxID=220873 RepID=A0ABQ9EWS0_TEGGR|nr:hypothetical protein KUTeg_012830 [Tegillarca granosa]